MLTGFHATCLKHSCLKWFLKFFWPNKFESIYPNIVVGGFGGLVGGVEVGRGCGEVSCRSYSSVSLYFNFQLVFFVKPGVSASIL